MKRKDIIKILTPGIVVGFILGFTLTMIVGVNKNEPLPNYIGGIMCCLVPTILNCTIVLKGTAKTLKWELAVSKAFVKAIPYSLLGGLLGIFFVTVIVETIFNISSCDIPRLTTALYQAPLGVVVSTCLAYLALRKYEKTVKYKRRTKKSDTSDKNKKDKKA